MQHTLVVLPPGIMIPEDGIGFCEFSKLLVSSVATLVAIRVVFHCEVIICIFYLLLGGMGGQSHDLIQVFRLLMSSAGASGV